MKPFYCNELLFLFLAGFFLAFALLVSDFFATEDFLFPLAFDFFSLDRDIHPSSSARASGFDGDFEDFVDDFDFTGK